MSKTFPRRLALAAVLFAALLLPWAASWWWAAQSPRGGPDGCACGGRKSYTCRTCFGVGALGSLQCPRCSGRGKCYVCLVQEFYKRVPERDGDGLTGLEGELEDLRKEVEKRLQERAEPIPPPRPAAE